MGRTGINVRIPDREHASRIVDGFSRDEKYLKDLISNYALNIDGALIDSMSFGELIRYGKVIEGVASKILKPSGVGKVFDQSMEESMDIVRNLAEEGEESLEALDEIHRRLYRIRYEEERPDQLSLFEEYSGR